MPALRPAGWSPVTASPFNRGIGALTNPVMTRRPGRIEFSFVETKRGAHIRSWYSPTLARPRSRHAGGLNLLISPFFATGLAIQMP